MAVGSPSAAPAGSERRQKAREPAVATLERMLAEARAAQALAARAEEAVLAAVLAAEVVAHDPGMDIAARMSAWQRVTVGRASAARWGPGAAPGVWGAADRVEYAQQAQAAFPARAAEARLVAA